MSEAIEAYEDLRRRSAKHHIMINFSSGEGV